MIDRAKPKLRLVKAELVADFVLDDGETLTPARFGPAAINAADWPDFDLQAAAEKAMSEQPTEAGDDRQERRRKGKRA